jgi:drug/metabolite transporter (DMT)-like permease
LAIKRWGSQIHPYTLTTLPMTYGALTLLAVSLMTEDIQSARWSATAVGSIVYLAIFGSVIGFVVYYTLLRKVAVTSLNLIAYLFPVVAVVLGYLVLDEVLEPLTLVGAGAIMIGIVIATYRRGVPGGGGSLSQSAGSDSASHLTPSNTVRQPRQ